MDPTDIRTGLQAEEGAHQQEDGLALPLSLANIMASFLGTCLLHLRFLFFVQLFVFSSVFVLRVILLVMLCVQRDRRLGTYYVRYDAN